MHTENIATFPVFRKRSRDWTTQELAEFYRVENALLQAGMRVETDRGITDEGDPWFVFCREDDAEPVAHFARIDGQYIIASPAYDGLARGYDFRSMVQQLIARHRLTPKSESGSSNVLFHPASLLILVVGAAFFKSPSQAKAAETQPAATPEKKSIALLFSSALDAASWALGAGGAAPEAFSGFSGEQLQIAAAMLWAETVDQAAAAPAPSFVAPASFEASTEVAHHAAALLQTGAADASAGASVATPATKAIAASTSAAEIAPVATSKAAAAAVVSLPVKSVEASSAGAASLAGLGGDYAFLAAKTAAIATSVTTTIAQSGDHLGAPSSSAVAAATAAPPVFHEDATVFATLPQGLAALHVYASVVQQPGSAAAFLTQNNIFLSFQGHPETLIGTTASATAATTTQTASISTQTIVMSAGKTGSVSGEVLNAGEFLQTLDEFLSQTPDASVIVSQQKYLFVGHLGANAPSSVLDSVTMTFNDGSSISIVGQPSTLHELISHVQ
jgi:hypothetical protein